MFILVHFPNTVRFNLNKLNCNLCFQNFNVIGNCTEWWGSCITRREGSREDDCWSLFSTATCIPINWKVCCAPSFCSCTFFLVWCFSNCPCSLTARAYMIPLLTASRITTWLSLFLCWRDLWYVLFFSFLS